MIIITDHTGRSWVTGCALCILTGKNTAGKEYFLGELPVRKTLAIKETKALAKLCAKWNCLNCSNNSYEAQTFALAY